MTKDPVKVKYTGNGIDIEESFIQIIGAFCIGKGFDFLSPKTTNLYMSSQYELYKEQLLDLLESIVSYQTGNKISIYYEEEILSKK